MIMFIPSPKTVLINALLIVILEEIRKGGSQDSSVELIKSWNVDMKPEWFLQVGESCSVEEDLQDHFDLFIKLRGVEGKRVGVRIDVAQQLAKRRCLKERLSRDREFGCVDGFCDCVDNSHVVSPKNNSKCVKYDGIPCRTENNDCYDGYLCGRLEKEKTRLIKNDSLTRNSVQREIDIDKMRIDVNMLQSNYFEILREIRRRAYLEKLRLEGLLLEELFLTTLPGTLPDGVTIPPIGNLNSTMDLDLSIIENAFSSHLPQFLQTNGKLDFLLEVLRDAIKYVQLHSVLVPSQSQDQKERVKVFIKRMFYFNNDEPPYLYTQDNINDLFRTWSERLIQTVMPSDKTKFYEARTKLRVATAKVCLCYNVASASECKVDKQPSKIFTLTNMSTTTKATNFGESKHIPWMEIEIFVIIVHLCLIINGIVNGGGFASVIFLNN